jgi:hypothetical protein
VVADSVPSGLAWPMAKIAAPICSWSWRGCPSCDPGRASGSLAATTGFWAPLGIIGGWLAGLGATILLWQRSSSRYFRAAPRY